MLCRPLMTRPQNFPWLIWFQCCEIERVWLYTVQVNLCQKLLFLHQITYNMTTDCSLNYKFSTWTFQAQTWGEHVVYRNCFWHSEQFLYTTCSPHVLQKAELLTKIYLYNLTQNWLKYFLKSYSYFYEVVTS
jgi:hypothetical protein